MSSSPPTFARRPRLAVHKFSSCDGCQLALLNLGEGLLDLAERVDIAHFAEFGAVDEQAQVDIALVEGSVSTPQEIERIAAVRANAKYLIALGACATSGGIQALRGLNDAQAWTRAVYARPEAISTLDRATALSAHVHVDLELWGCPVSARQLLAAMHDLLAGVSPAPSRDKLCMECKRLAHVCVVVAHGLPCMGPVTATGCGVLCPAHGRDCYGCTGPAESPNVAAMVARLQGLGLSARDVRQRFLSIHSGAPEFAAAARHAETHADG